ncbi:MAG: BsaWI family type II restriction enzyme [Thermoplasmata archaeon]
MSSKRGTISAETHERQSQVTRSGDRWENRVADFLRRYRNGSLLSHGIDIIDGGSERVVREHHERLYRVLQIPVVNHRYDRTVWGDIDLIASIQDVPIAVISCKTSLHGRLTETLFYSLLYRAVKNLRVVFVTPDRGRQGGSGWQSEWGSTGPGATKDRLLAEAFLAGVYVENSPEWCPGLEEGQGTKFGGVVKRLTQLPDDLVRWSSEFGVD